MKFHLAALFIYLACDGIIDLFWHLFFLLHSFHQWTLTHIILPPYLATSAVIESVPCALLCLSSLVIAEVSCLEAAVISCSGTNQIVSSGIILLPRRLTL